MDVAGTDELHQDQMKDNLCPILPFLFTVRCLVKESSPALKWGWIQEPGRCKAFLSRQYAMKLTLKVHHLQLLLDGQGWGDNSKQIKNLCMNHTNPSI